jgi:tRNA nucleotidyltransferase (CCA-adding enzyme)
MQLPADLARVIAAVQEVGNPILVGGCVRDWLLGLHPKDFDIEVFECDYEPLRRVIAAYGPTNVVGKSFGVVKVRVGGHEYDFSLPRRETKAGAGHRGFDVVHSASLSFAEAAARRDFTINAIGYDPQEGRVIDPHGGQEDLRASRLRHVGPAFVEDPLRVLRGFQLAARFDLDLAPETAALCRDIKQSFTELPKERIWHEWEKWARLSSTPSRGIHVLDATGWLDHFPELAALKDCPQDPEWHPEGDVLTHTGHCLDALARMPEWQNRSPAARRILMFAVLIHDFGKATTTHRAERRGVQRWVSPGHDKESGRLAEGFLQSIAAPNALLDHVRPLVENHMYHVQASAAPRPASIRRLARRLAPATIEDLALVMRADTRGRPPMEAKEHAGVEALLAGARHLQLEKQAPRPLLLGRHLLAAGLEAGPHFKPILDELFEAQMDGAFSTEQEARAYLRRYLERNDR